MSNSAPEGNIGFLLRFLKFAQNTHPIVKLATIVAGFAVAAAIVVAALGRDHTTIVIVMLMLLAALVVYSMIKFIESESTSPKWAGLLLLWTAILLVWIFLGLAIYALIECKPRTLVYLLGWQTACEPRPLNGKRPDPEQKKEAPYVPSIRIIAQGSTGGTPGGFYCMRQVDDKPAVSLGSTRCGMSGLEPCTPEVQGGYCLIVYGPHASADSWSADEVKGETWQCYRNRRSIGERIERPGLGNFSAAARAAVCAQILTNSIDRKAGGG